MKTSGKLQLVTIFSVVAVLGFTLSSFSGKNNTISRTAVEAYNKVNVNITISSITTQEEFEEIMDMLKEHDIKASFTNIKRNDEGEITSIKIKLEDLLTGSESLSNIQSSSPINDISFGRKKGALFITQGGLGHGNFTFFGNSMRGHGFTMDSIIGNRFMTLDSLKGKFFNFDHGDGNVFMFNGNSFNLDDLKEGMNDFITIEEDENGQKRIIIKGGSSEGMNFFFDKDSDDNSWRSNDQKFRFYDDPNTEKLIVIDGKESNFERLDALAKENKLDTVDVLKGKTAMSIYGPKAKDGAIIATTTQ